MNPHDTDAQPGGQDPAGRGAGAPNGGRDATGQPRGLPDASATQDLGRSAPRVASNGLDTRTTQNPVITLLGATGRSVVNALGGVGRFVGFAGRTLGWMLRPPFYLRELGQQIMQIGWFSLPVVALTALFTGAALALQIYAGSARFSAEFAVPSITAIGMVRELGPVLGGLMVAARVASSIAAEIGTMKVSEQIDALQTLAVEPMQYLTVPRVVAATLAMPVLVAVGDSIGIMGGFAVGVTRLEFEATAYLRNTLDFLEFWDIASGLVKGAVFGFLVALSGCYFGMQSGRGAQGVGAATKSAVVVASVLILAANYLLTEAFFSAG